MGITPAYESAISFQIQSEHHSLPRRVRLIPDSLVDLLPLTRRKALSKSLLVRLPLFQLHLSALLVYELLDLILCAQFNAGGRSAKHARWECVGKRREKMRMGYL